MGSVVHSVLYCQIVTDTVIMRTILAFILLVTASVVTQGRRTKSLHSKSGELSHSLHKEASNSVYHGPKYSSGQRMSMKSLQERKLNTTKSYSDTRVSTELLTPNMIMMTSHFRIYLSLPFKLGRNQLTSARL